MTESNKVLLERREGPVLVLTMNRPKCHHALNFDLSECLAAALTRAEKDKTVSVIVITGSGDTAFCAGQDMLEVSEAGEAAADALPSAYIALDKFSHTSVPIIAAINGYCFGGGAMLAIACDIRLASTSATFRLPGAEYGLVVGAAFLPRLIGASKAKELIYTAREFDAEEAYSCGLVSSLHSSDKLMKSVLNLAGEIAVNSDSAVRESKRVIDAATLSERAASLESVANQRLRGSPDQNRRFRSATRKVTGQ